MFYVGEYKQCDTLTDWLTHTNRYIGGGEHESQILLLYHLKDKDQDLCIYFYGPSVLVKYSTIFSN